MVNNSMRIGAYTGEDELADTKRGLPLFRLSWVFAFGTVVALNAGCSDTTTARSDPEAYWHQLEEHRLTPDALGHWNHVLSTVDLISYAQRPLFEPPEREYDLHMYRKWVEEHGDDQEAVDRVYAFFANDHDYGWPAELKGIPWVYALNGWVWSAPSVAIIEPGRTAEAAFLVREFIKVYRSPAAWKDYAIDQGWGDPMLENIMWKYPLLMAEGIYGLMTGDIERYRPEMEAVAEDLYAHLLENLSLPEGKGFVGGVCCEPNHWFPQCNSGGALALAMYDKLYGVDPRYQVNIGEEYRKAFLKFLNEEMRDPRSGRLYRRYHPEGPLGADRAYSGFAQIVVACHMKMFDPKLADALYDMVVTKYVQDDPLIGTFMLEVPEYDDFRKALNRGSQLPGMLGEPAVNILILLEAAREHGDRKTLARLLDTFVDLVHPYYRQGEVRYDETNDDPANIGDRTVGQILNMYSGWILLGKVHLGWETIINHDWSKHRDENGLLLNREVMGSNIDSRSK